MNHIGEGSRLTYENFIYIVMSSTFRDEDTTLYQGSGHGLEQQQLVLDVEGTRVFLSPKEPGKRNQLWRMTSSGMIQVWTVKICRQFYGQLFLNLQPFLFENVTINIYHNYITSKIFVMNSCDKHYL